MSTAIFISYSREDKSTAELIAELLDAHGLQPWYDQHSIEVGAKYIEKIERSIKAADAMIIILSENAIRSKWVTREITLFRSKPEKAIIIPMKIEDVLPDDVYDGLGEYHCVDYRKEPLASLKKIFQVLGKEFLDITHNTHKATEENRSVERRKSDRREAPPEVKLRNGLWKAFSKATELGKFEIFEPIFSRHSRIDLIGEMLAELRKYNVTAPGGEAVELRFTEFETIVATAWEQATARNPNITAIAAAEAIANALRAKYKITPKDRRQQDRRQKAPQS